MLQDSLMDHWGCFQHTSTSNWPGHAGGKAGPFLTMTAPFFMNPTFIC